MTSDSSNTGGGWDLDAESAVFVVGGVSLFVVALQVPSDSFQISYN